MEQKGKTFEGMRESKISMLVGFLIFMILISVWGWRKWQYGKMITTLTSMSPEQVTIFRIHPPVGNFIEFKALDPIVTEFFQALTDHRPYSPTHDRAWKNQQWFLEVAAGKTLIQISFHIPYEKGEIVAGKLGKYGKHRDTFYGDFQSQKLFQWYQQYSHRWLEPEHQE